MRRGFTLIELLVVLAILAITAVIVVPAIGRSATTQVSMATKDSLRLMRYARNMALQTQQPVYLTFSPGKIVLSPTEGGAVAPSEENPEKGKPDAKKGKRALPANAVEGGDVEEVGLTKHYAQVAFTLLGFDDSIRQGRSADSKQSDFARRGLSEEPLQKGEGETFTITVRANGTTRPFSMRVHEKDAASDSGGDRVAFDFLCSGTIADKE